MQMHACKYVLSKQLNVYRALTSYCMLSLRGVGTGLADPAAAGPKFALSKWKPAIQKF